MTAETSCALAFAQMRHLRSRCLAASFRVNMLQFNLPVYMHLVVFRLFLARSWAAPEVFRARSCSSSRMSSSAAACCCRERYLANHMCLLVAWAFLAIRLHNAARFKSGYASSQCRGLDPLLASVLARCLHMAPPGPHQLSWPRSQVWCHSGDL